MTKAAATRALFCEDAAKESFGMRTQAVKNDNVVDLGEKSFWENDEVLLSFTLDKL